MNKPPIYLTSASRWPRVRISDPLCRAPLYIGAMVASSALGVVIAFQDALFAVRVVAGLPIMAALVRYRYALLLCWVLIGTLIGTSAPIVTGHNLDTAFTVSTLLLMPVMPIKDTFKRMPALALLLAYLLWVLLGINVSPLDHVTFLKEWTLMLDLLAVAVLTTNVLSTRQRMARFIDLLLVAPTSVALYGIYGYVTHQNVLAAGPGEPARITSIFANAVALGLFLSTVAPLALYRVFTARKAGRLIASLVLCILLLALALTFSRGAMLGLALCLVITIPLLPSQAMKRGMIGGMLGLAALTAVLVTVGKVPIFARFFGSDVASLNGRALLWNALLQRFDPTQLRGHGLRASFTLLGGLRLFSHGAIGTGEIGNSGLEAHNLFLSTLYDFGIIGLTLLILMFVALAVGLIRGMRKATGDQRILFVMTFATFVAVLVQQVEGADLFDQAIGVDFWIIVALPFALCWSRSGAPAMPMGASPATTPGVAGSPHREDQRPRGRHYATRQAVALAARGRVRRVTAWKAHVRKLQIEQLRALANNVYVFQNSRAHV